MKDVSVIFAPEPEAFIFMGVFFREQKFKDKSCKLICKTLCFTIHFQLRHYFLSKISMSSLLYLTQLYDAKWEQCWPMLPNKKKVL